MSKEEKKEEKIPEADFVHLHCHSEFSSLDGGSQVAKMPDKLNRLGMRAMALTDHGVMQGVSEFHDTLRKEGIKPILGIEAYLTEDRFNKDRRNTPTWHITLLAENNTGYQNLCKLSSWAFIDGTITTFGRPRARADWDLMKKYHEGVICLTGCMAGPVMNAIMIDGNLSLAKERVKKMIDIFGQDNVYGELQNVGIVTGVPGDSELAEKLGKKPLSKEEAENYEGPHGDLSDEIEEGEVPISQTEANGALVDICNELGLKYVATGDVHYLEEDDADPHDAMLCIGTGQIKRGERRFSLLPKKYHMRSEEEMKEAIADWPEALTTTLEVAERCNAEIEYGRELLPSFPIPKEFKNAKEYLQHLCEEGRKQLYPEDSEHYQASIERLNMELGVINNMGFNDYFLIVWDLIREAKERNIPTGPGRGSAAGSIVSYVLGITQMCPLEHDLLFERFLNPDRQSMPDVDLDFGVANNKAGIAKRDELIQYSIDKYNHLADCDTAVAQIVTFSKFKAKGALRDSSRVLAEPNEEGKKSAVKLGDKLASYIPDDPKATMRSVWQDEHEGKQLRAAYKRGGLEAEIIKQAGWMEGLVRAYSTHAAAVIIADHDLTDDLPLQKLSEKKPLEVQYEMGIAERLGLLKMDFLGLRNLDVIWDTLEKVKHVRGIEIKDPYHDIPLDDSETYQLFARGETVGSFQFESAGMQSAMRSIRPTEFNDLVAIVSLYRPGAMAQIQDYSDRKNGRKQVEFLDERLKPILEETYATCLTGEAKIQDAVNGQIYRIEDLGEILQNKRKLNQELYVQGIGSDYSPQIEKVKHWHNHGKRKVYQVKLKSGETIKATPDHKFLTENGWKQLSTLTTGEHISTPKELLVTNTKSYDFDKLRMLAYLLADGYLASGGSEFYNKNKTLIKAFTQSCKQAFPEDKIVFHTQDRNVIRASIRKDNKNKNNHVCTQTNSWLRELGLKWNNYSKNATGAWRKAGVSSHEKFIPNFIKQLDKRSISFFIACLWDCDGGLHDKQGQRYFYYKTISETLATDLQFLLTRLGIDSKIYSYPYINEKKPNQNAYQVTVYDSYNFFKKVQPFLLSNNKKIVGDKTRSSGTSLDRKLFAEEVINNKRGKSFNSLDKGRGYLARTVNTDNYIGSRIKESTVIEVSKYLPIPNTIKKTNCNWNEIISIREAGIETVYDIEVENIHSFVANGINVHNCLYQEQSMRIARELASFSPGETDDLRKAIGKKKHDMMAELKPKFMKGCQDNNVQKEVAEQLWAINEASADYSFNKCADASTRVILPDGTRIRLSEAYNQQPDHIMSMWSDGEIRPHAVKKIVKTGRKELYQVKCQSGRQIKATADHRLLTNKGYLPISEMSVGTTELITMPMISEKQRQARSETMKRLSQRPERKEQDLRASKRMQNYQQSRSLKEQQAHMKKMHKEYPYLTDNGIQAMHKKIAWLRKNDAQWVQEHAEKSLASVRETYNSGPGYGYCSIASNGMWCASNPEREMCEWLIENNIDFEMHKVLKNGKICDFYFDGLYWEMDGMDRSASYFENKYAQLGLPYVVVTPEDYQEIISEKLSLEHASNGDPIVSIEPCGAGSTFDIEMESNGPKNFLANGIVSHNSHAACYAFIGYITGYLKAHYPEEYMAALLSSVMGKKDKPRFYLTEAKRMGVEVLPPDLNRSLRDFAVREKEEGEGLEILFGLTAIKGVGNEIVERIINERDQRGSFKSMFDLIRRMPGLNKTVVGSLIRAGALDFTGAPRQAMAEEVEESITRIKKQRKDKEKAFTKEAREYLENNPNDDDELDKRGKRKLSALEKKGIEGGAIYALDCQQLPSYQELLEPVDAALLKEQTRACRADIRKKLKEEGAAAHVLAGIAQEESEELSEKEQVEQAADIQVQEMAKERKKLKEKLTAQLATALKAIKDEEAAEEGFLAAMEAEADPPLSGPEWPEVEKLNYEREKLGIYVTGHPLEADARKWAHYVDKGLGHITDAEIGKVLKVVGALVGKQPITTRKGDLMYKVAIEDLTGSQEIILFPSTLEGGIEKMLEVGQVIAFDVSVREDNFSKKDEEDEEDTEGGRPIQLAASRVYNWDPSRLENPPKKKPTQEKINPIDFHVKDGQLTPHLVDQLKEICQQYPGEHPIRLLIEEQKPLISDALKVDDNDELREKLRALE